MSKREKLLSAIRARANARRRSWISPDEDLERALIEKGNPDFYGYPDEKETKEPEKAVKDGNEKPPF